MTAEERPLHVLVAEALGWTNLAPDANENGDWGGDVPAKHSVMGVEGSTIVYRYDGDWDVTGPLIEKYGISIARSIKLSSPPQPGENWHAQEPVSKLWADGWSKQQKRSSPLVAVCRLILALKAAGKLEAA